MKFSLLGPLELSVDGKSWTLGSTRQRVLLATLLLEANHVIPISRLIEAVWDDVPPTTAKSQIQTCISALRRVLKNAGAESTIATWPTGYEIRIPDNALDISEFTRLAAKGLAAAAAGRQQVAAQDLRAGLALWRGTAVADVESKTVQAAAIRLNERRLSVLEECIALEIDFGRHEDLIGELTELVMQHPLRERLRALHMLALYRSERQVEALESFQQARQLFIEELGLEPGAELSALQQAILSKDKALEFPEGSSRRSPWNDRGDAVIPRQLPAAIADFTGRDDIAARLVTVLSAGGEEEATDRYLPVAVLVGLGGVGKTTLAVHVAHAMRSCYPDGQLFLQLRGSDGQPIGSFDLLARLLSVFGIPQSAMPESLAERASTYRSLLSDRRMLVVLDDAENTAQLKPLIPGNPACGVVVTSRHLLAGLEGAKYFQVDDLEEETGTEFIGKVIGPERMAGQEESARALVRLCGCLPLALRIAAAKLVERPHWTIAQMVARMADESKRLDELVLADTAIRATLEMSYRSLTRPAQRLFARLGLVESEDFAPWVGAPLLNVDAQAAGDLLDVLVRAHLVEPQADENGVLRFHMHELIRIYARELLAAEVPTAERAQAVQRLLGCWLFLASEAHRRISGGDFAVLHGGASVWPLPCDVTDELLGKPLDWFRSERTGLVSAVSQAGHAALDEMCWDLAVTSVTLFESENQIDDWRKTHEIALDVTRRAGNRRGEASVLSSLGTLEISQQPNKAGHYLRPALAIFETLGDAHGCALALSGLGSVDRLNGRYHSALSYYQQALTGFQQVGDKVYEVDALANMAQIEMSHQDFTAAQVLLDRARHICRAIKAPRPAAQTGFRFGEFYLRTGELDQAERSFSSVLRLVRDEGDLVGEAYALVGLVMVHTDRAQYALAEEHWTEALALSATIRDNLVQGRLLLAGAELYLAKGELEHALTLHNEALIALSEIGPAPVWRVKLIELKAMIYERSGRTSGSAAARQEVLALARDLDLD